MVTPASSIRASTGSSGISTSVNRSLMPPSASSVSSAGRTSRLVSASAAARRAVAVSSAPVSALTGRSGSEAPYRLAARSSSVWARNDGLVM